MATILIIFSSTDGHTETICHRLKQVIEQESHQVTVVAVEKVRQLDWRPFDKIVIGASIRYGKHSRPVLEFINTNATLLGAKPGALFSVNIVARKPQKNRPETNPYLRKLLTQIAWRPKELAVFAGKLDYKLYKGWERLAIRFIMKITGGPTQPDTCIDFTPWDQVEGLAKRVAKLAPAQQGVQEGRA